MDRARSLKMLQRVRQTLRRHHMLAGGEGIVVAVSGGPDSMALLHVLCRMSDELSLRLHVVTVDHGIHAASGEHAAFVRRTAQAWGIPASSARANARAWARRHGCTLEEAARAVRYRALARVAARVGASHLALAHTADDQVETVLLWLLRGASADGLAGMPAGREHGGLRVIRPLLDLWRHEIVAYLGAEGVPSKTDPTNRLRGPLRNRIRLDLIPRLSGYNPGIKAVLRRLAEQVADDAALLDRLAEEAGAKVLRLLAVGLAIDAEQFRAMPVALQRRVAHRALCEAGGKIRDMKFVHIERIRAMAESGRSGEMADLPGLRAERRGGRIVVTRTRARRTGSRRMLQ